MDFMKLTAPGRLRARLGLASGTYQYQHNYNNTLSPNYLRVAQRHVTNAKVTRNLAPGSRGNMRTLEPSLLVFVCRLNNPR